MHTREANLCPSFFDLLVPEAEVELELFVPRLLTLYKLIWCLVSLWTGLDIRHNLTDLRGHIKGQGHVTFNTCLNTVAIWWS